MKNHLAICLLAACAVCVLPLSTLAQDEPAKPATQAAEATPAATTQDKPASDNSAANQEPSADEKAAMEKLAEEKKAKKEAHDKMMEAAKIAEVVTLVKDLKNPTGIAVQPETGHVFVADSGNFRVVRFADGMLEEVITDFPKDKYGENPTFDIGPLGLAFIDKDTLVVGGGGKPDGEEMLRVYKVPAIGAAAIKADKMHGDAKMLVAEDDVVGEGNFYGVAKGDKGIYVTCNGDDGKGWVSMATLAGDKLNEFTRKIPTKELVEVDAPVAITISPEFYVAVGQMGEINVAKDSLLTFYNQEGEMKANFKTELNDISGLAYGPNAKRLFATDFNWLDGDNGGLYKIIGVGETQCKTEEIAKLKRPSALAFTPDGNLFVTLAGDHDKSNGQLVVIKGLDVDQKTMKKQLEEQKMKEEKEAEEKKDEE